MIILNLKSFKLLTHGLPNDTIDLLPTQNPNLNGGCYCTGIVTKSECLAALHDKQPNYQKGKALPIILDQVNDALSRANKLRIQRDTPIAELHEKAGALTTVHFLVHDLLTAIGVQ